MSGCPALCFHRLGKCNGGGRGYFFVLTRLRSSSQIESYLQCFRPFGDQTFFYQKRKLAKKLTPNRFLTKQCRTFFTHQFIRHVRVSDELTANVLFAVAESYPLCGKAQRWRCHSHIEQGFIATVLFLFYNEWARYFFI